MAKSSKNTKSVEVEVNTSIYEIAKIMNAKNELKEALQGITDPKIVMIVGKKMSSLYALAQRITKAEAKMEAMANRDVARAAKAAARDKKRDEKKIEKKAKLEDQIAKLTAKMEALKS